MYYLFILGKFIANILPRRIVYPLAWFLAAWRFCFYKNDRRNVIYNLSPIVKDKAELVKKSFQCFVNFSYYLADFFRYSKLNKRFVDKYVRIDGRENIDRVIAEKKGILFLTAHLGNYELGGAVTALLGYPLYVVALTHKDKRVNEFFDAQREMTGLKVIPANVAVKKCFSLLKNAGMAAFLADRVFTGCGVKAEMFSRYAQVPKGPAFFALKTGACLVPGFFIRENKWFYRLIFDKPIYIDLDSATEQSIIEQYIPVLEKYIGNYADQWYLFEKYWSDSNSE